MRQIDKGNRVRKQRAKASVGPFDFEDLGFATVDHGRRMRIGLGEVVYGESKTVRQVIEIAKSLSKSGSPVLITRLSEEKLKALKKHFRKARANPTSGSFTLNPIAAKKFSGDEPYVCIVTAGTSDIAVAEEAADVCLAMGAAHTKLNDIGVAGIHRVVKNLGVMQNAAALIVIAGMEGALPSVIGGLVSKPIFAVPTDVGYGANLKGITPLLSMLSSCAPGIAVMNINSGFSAGFAACRVVNTVKEFKSKVMKAER